MRKISTYTEKCLRMCLLFAVTTALFVCRCQGMAGEVYSSLTHIENLMHFDSRVTKVLSLLPSKSESVFRFLHLSSATLAQSLDYPEGLSSPYITGNPLHILALVKRFVFYWNDVKSVILAQQNVTADLHVTIEQLLKDESLTYIPISRDLQGTYQAIGRLQKIYFLSIDDLVQGKILQYPSSTQLTPVDCLQVGDEMMKENVFVTAYMWYKKAEEIATDFELKTYASRKVEYAADKHNNPYNYDDSHFPQPIEHPLQNNVILSRIPSYYENLCQGNYILEPEKAARLKCGISSRNSLYLVIHPIRYEVMHLDPTILVFYDVLSEYETDYVKGKATQRLSRSLVSAIKQPAVSEIRVSHTGWLQADGDKVLTDIQKRLEAITGYQLSERKHLLHPFGSEYLQVLSYGIGGHYGPHLDALFIEDVLPNLDEMMRNEQKLAGDRLATWMFYLSDVEKGGYTAFPELKVAVSPVKGSAVFWHNLKFNGEVDKQTLHGGCPVLLGHKWVANKWIRENMNFLNRPCSANPAI